MLFPYERYVTLAQPLTVYYPTGEEALARSVLQTINGAAHLLTGLLGVAIPDIEILLVDMADWPLVPHSELEEIATPHPYWTDTTSPPCIVVPVEVDPIFGEITPQKFAFMLYHELALALLEEDPRPWPASSPLWADEWQFKFAAVWLSQRLDNVQAVVNTDLHAQYADVFEPEADGKTPVTVRGFDWYEDTSAEDYLVYELLLEQFAADLLARYEPDILPRFLALYRAERELLSDDVTTMLATVLGPGGGEWLEGLVYF